MDDTMCGDDEVRAAIATPTGGRWPLVSERASERAGGGGLGRVRGAVLECSRYLAG